MRKCPNRDYMQIVDKVCVESKCPDYNKETGKCKIMERKKEEKRKKE